MWQISYLNFSLGMFWVDMKFNCKVLSRCVMGRYAQTGRASSPGAPGQAWHPPGWHWWNDGSQAASSVHASWSGSFSGHWHAWLWWLSSGKQNMSDVISYVS